MGPPSLMRVDSKTNTLPGSLGIATLSQYCWKIERDGQYILLQDKPFESPDAAILTAGFREAAYPHTSCTILGGEHSFILDWGSTDHILVREQTELGRQLLETYKPSPKTVVIDGVNRAGVEDIQYEIVLPEIQIGNVVLRNQPVVIRKNAPANLIGARILQQFNAIFNFRQGKLELILAPAQL